MRIVVEQGETVVVDQEVEGNAIYIGRHEHCQIKLPVHDAVAPRHLVLFEENGTWFVDTLHDSYQTTQLNGHLLQGRQELPDGGELRVGDLRITYHADEKVEEKADEKVVPFLVVARDLPDLQDTDGYGAADLHVPPGVIIKHRMDTFSLAKGRIEYLSNLSLRMMEMPDVRSLLGMVLDSLLRDFEARVAWIGLRTDEEGHLNLSAGRDLAGRPIDAPATARQLSFAAAECARALLLQSLPDHPDRSCIASPLISPDGSLGMIYLESTPGKNPYTVSDLDTLVFGCHHMAMAIDRLLRREKAQLDHVRSADQELARKVQSRTAPWQLPQWPELHLAVLSEPGTGPCTDFYDVLPLGERQAMLLWGQTTAGGSDAAVCIAEMSAAFRIGAVHRDVPAVLLRQMNWLMFTTAGEPRRISAGVLAIDPQTGEFLLAAAGRVHAFFLGANGKVVRVQIPENPWIGESRKSRYEAVKGRLGTDQTLVLCTGGIFSVVSGKATHFDEAHLSDLLSDSADQPPARILGDLAEDLVAFSGGKKPVPDITLLLLRKGRPPQK